MLVGISSHVVAFNLSQNRCAAGWALLKTVSAGGAVQIAEAARLIKTNERKIGGLLGSSDQVETRVNAAWFRHGYLLCKSK